VIRARNDDVNLLSARQRADFLVRLPAGHADDLGEPFTRHLDGKVRELRFRLSHQQARIT